MYYLFLQHGSKADPISAFLVDAIIFALILAFAGSFIYVYAFSKKYKKYLKYKHKYRHNENHKKYSKQKVDEFRHSIYYFHLTVFLKLIIPIFPCVFMVMYILRFY